MSTRLQKKLAKAIVEDAKNKRPTVAKDLLGSVGYSEKSIDWEECKLSEGDIYHTAMYADYDVQGISLEERQKIIEKYHGEDRDKWPAQIIIQST